MHLRAKLTLAALAFSTAAFSQIVNTATPDSFQVRYASNLNIGDSVINVTNNGATGNICVNVYTFDPAEELVSCCTCSVTPNALESISVRGSLTSNPLTPAIPTSVVIKLIASAGGACNASSVTGLAAGMRAWGTTIHALPTTPVSYGVTETEFSKSDLSAAELAHVTTFCGFIQANGSGFGICAGCSGGGLGASKQ
jgi:hypothetical protein